MSREGRKIRVLVADDSRSMRLLIRSAFPFGQGLPEFCDASDGKEAVAIYKAQRCDIVLLDIRMPVLNGLAALEEIRAYDEDAFVVMISGECTQENLAAAREAGAKNMVRKPVSQQVVKDILTAYHERERRPVSILAADQSEEIIGALTVGLGILKIRHRMYRADSAAEAERAFQSRDVGQQVLVADHHTFHDDLASD